MKSQKQKKSPISFSGKDAASIAYVRLTQTIDKWDYDWYASKVSNQLPLNMVEWLFIAKVFGIATANSS